jgi:Spy/CpxP family protein refolding chaperone
MRSQGFETHHIYPGGKQVRHTLALLAAVCLFSLASIPWIAAQQVRPVSTGATSMDEVLAAVRADLQATRADVMAKNLSLTAEQAAKFWPVYEAYQKRQNVIMDDHLKDLQRYIESFDTLDDAGALALIRAHLDRDAKMASLRSEALGDFQKVLGAKLAVRAIQIDRRLSLAYQMEMASKIPLAH